MRIPEGTLVGVLATGNGTATAEVRIGRSIAVGEMEGFPVWQNGEGVSLIFLMPQNRPAPLVKKSGRRQAGAFILHHGENFSISGQEQDGMVYQFRVSMAVEVMTKEDSLCHFCRSRVDGCGMSFLRPGLEGRLRGKALCRICAEALGDIEGAASDEP